MLALFTDFGLQGPYVGLLKLTLARHAPGLPIIDLFHDVPAFDIQAAAYLLAAYVPEFPERTVFVGVVDPGVGGARAGAIIRADNRFFVGPDNGLFDRVSARARQLQTWRISWVPPRLSASFHGRDLFAPIAAMLATDAAPPAQLGTATSREPRDWPDDLARIVYVDRYGNAMTGMRAHALDDRTVIRCRSRIFHRARTFSDVPVGQGFWYENSSGLVELAVNQGSASERFGLVPGDTLQLEGNTFTVIRAH